MMPSGEGIRLAARPSPLSRRQAEEASRWLGGSVPSLRATFLWVASRGDRDRRSQPPDLGSVGVFEREVDAAVAAGKADVAVHSLKDLPLGEPEQALHPGLGAHLGPEAPSAQGCRGHWS